MASPPPAQRRSSAPNAAPASGRPARPAPRPYEGSPKFCPECGFALQAAARGHRRAQGAWRRPRRRRRRPPQRTRRRGAPASTVAERKLVSVLFADLVGFTTMSESRDAEAVREQLTEYFGVAQEIITRYGGTVEKFIGDAVMAVWGTPVAHEDDAERAVRAALELVDAVGHLGHDEREAERPRRRAHRRGGRDARRLEPGDGRRRPRQHRLATPVGRPAGNRDRRRGDPPERGERDRLRAGRRAGAEGQGQPGARLPRRAGGRPARRGRPRRPARGAVHGPRRRDAPRQGPLPRRARARSARGCCRSSGRPGSARAGWPGSSSSTSTASP